MRIVRTSFPETSLLNRTGFRIDYKDAFRGGFPDSKDLVDIDMVGKWFFSTGPKWVDRLFYVRNRIVRAFGLKTSGDGDDRRKVLENFTATPGQRIGLFTVCGRTDTELLLGEDDRHLNFRVSLLLEPSGEDPSRKLLTVSTAVQFHNGWGRIYFQLIAPFHSLIVPSMLRRILSKAACQD